MSDEEIAEVATKLAEILHTTVTSTEGMGNRYCIVAVIGEDGLCLTAQGATEEDSWPWYESAAALFSSQYEELEQRVANAIAELN